MRWLLVTSLANVFDLGNSTETKFREAACKQTRPGAESHQPKAPLDSLDDLQLLEIINEMLVKAVGDLRTTYFIRFASSMRYSSLP